jgi:O-methyltransferase involved in polyketide biosynthesis
MLIPLYARASETRQREPLLRDPHAVATVERLAYDFSRFRDPTRLRSLALRAAIVDEIARRFMRRYPFCTIVEIGAGLSARFERVDDSRVRWFDLDLPDVTSLRERFFVETSRRSFIAASVLDTAWPAIVKADGYPPFLIVAEGVLPYLSVNEVKTAIGLVAEWLADAHVVFDTIPITPGRAIRNVAPGVKAQLAWTCEDPAEIERWHPGYRLMESWTPGTLPPALQRRLPWSYRTALAAIRVLDCSGLDFFRVNVLSVSGRS